MSGAATRCWRGLTVEEVAVGSEEEIVEMTITDSQQIRNDAISS